MSRIREAFLKVWIRIGNMLRWRRRVPPYVLLTLAGEIEEITPPRPQVPLGRFYLPPEQPSMSSLRRMFEQMARDPRVEGVVLRIECVASGAVYQSLRTLLLDFRARGKRLVAYTNSFGPFQYYLASACDQIVMPPSAEFNVTGLLREYLFFKEALDQLGVGVDVINVSPYKSAFDEFTRTDFSAESRAQAEWLLDAQFDELVRGIASGRKLEETRVRELIDRAPFGAREAVECGLLDAVLYEDELEEWLTSPNPSPQPEAENGKKQAKPQRKLGLYDDVRRNLLRYRLDRPNKVIGVVRVEGTIVEGRSQSLPLPLPVPFLGNRMAGSESVVQALRRAADDDRLAAVILYVDSRGGSALASDLIAREVRRVRERKPVVAYMSGVAASGGYYVAALAQTIVAQPLTITGSIGVIAAKPNMQQAQGKLYLHSTILKRGERADLYSPAAPLNADQYQAIAGMVQRIYDDFKHVVADGRHLDFQQLESLAGGRVWTGSMAHEKGLIDVLGDFTVAVDHARDLAKLPPDKKPLAISIDPPHRMMLPTPRSIRTALQALAPGWANPQPWITWLARARAWAILPWQIGNTD